jgi:hypothetical protein
MPCSGQVQKALLRNWLVFLKVGRKKRSTPAGWLLSCPSDRCVESSFVVVDVDMDGSVNGLYLGIISKSSNKHAIYGSSCTKSGMVVYLEYNAVSSNIIAARDNVYA